MLRRVEFFVLFGKTYCLHLQKCNYFCPDLAGRKALRSATILLGDYAPSFP